MKLQLTLLLAVIFECVLAQQFKIRQDDDQILFFNESDRSVEVWVRMQDIAVNEVVIPGELKKFTHPEFFSPGDLEDSEIFYAYSYRALEADIKASLSNFYKELEQKRKILNRGYKTVNQPFYRTDMMQEFLETEEQKNRWQSLMARDLDDFTGEVVLPPSRNLLGNVHNHAEASVQKAVKEVSRFLATEVRDESENSMFRHQMNKLETLFYQYSDEDNTLKNLGSLKDNDFKVFTNNPGTDFGVYLTTNNIKLIRDYPYREMDTRGFNFEVQFSQRFAQSRVGKRRTLNYYGAASYLSLKDKEFELKKSFITLGPQLRFTGYYENQVQLIAETGIVLDITGEKYMAATDKRQFGMYAGGELSLLFIRLGMRYYSNLANDELMPEGNWFYRLGIVGKF